MEREIKFRGKDKDNNWVYGDLIHGVGAYKNGVFILPMTINLAYVPNCDPINGVRVDENTVCQFTGLKDKNGKDIYEDDILKVFDMKILVEFKFGMFGYQPKFFDFIGLGGNHNFQFQPNGIDENFEVIGNKYDNKELLKGE